jgi:type VI secretion system Hcp family effector
MSKIFINIPGITGSSKVKGYEGWLDVDSVDMDVTRQVSICIGQVHSRETGLPQFSEIVVHKPLDHASHQLFAYACSSKVISTPVEIHVCSNEPEYQPYYQYILENVKISQYRQRSATGTLPGERFNLNYTQIEMVSTLKNSPERVGYDLQHAKLL